MKKIFLIAVFALFVVGAANAQEYKPFQLYLGLGYAMPSDGGGGILFDIEPAYRLSDEIAIGLRLESAAMARAIGDNEGTISGNGSYTLNGKYYLSNDGFRPYVGLGVGLFSLASVSTNANSVAGESKIGFYPRLGFDAGHFNLNLDYNIIGASETANGGVDIKNSYLGIRIGAFIFGGRN